jgi:hypothetical protein
MASIVLLTAVMTSSCSNAPKIPDWQIEAKGSMDRAVVAYLEGNTRVETAEMSRARRQLSSTGRADLMAAAELTRCATRVASLVFEPCAGFEALRPDATEAQRAYADYLRGQLAPAQIPLLPATQRAGAARMAGDNMPLQGIDDPLSLLIAAGVLLETGKASPATIAQAVDTASSQGWRRPLLAWLRLQAKRATLAGQTDEAARLQRQLALIQGSDSKPDEPQMPKPPEGYKTSGD